MAVAVAEARKGDSCVIGGSGKTGRRVAEQLVARGATPVTASRSGQRRFGWRDKASWRPAVSARAVCLVDAQTDDTAELMAEFTDAAVRAGVGRLVLLSVRAWEQADDTSGFAVERAVQKSGAGSAAAWTVLRPTWFAQNFSEDSPLRDAVAAGRVEPPTGEGLEPFIDTTATKARSTPCPGHAR
ncbi:hypothetical protein QQY66_49545 [Streptomyces sp. DG2A-72]|uniref:SDR family oxidoreductase n=1 Tax=Streptomyces sp. DG2A-72 TaxID=3051386 RepID=UPI00265BB4BE|nr:hypothetical protein [Streptomyces sp. DG2A-72]MDO0939353.1 hypothetical protein [Streptomyces sp. DG2A-72]